MDDDDLPFTFEPPRRPGSAARTAPPTRRSPWARRLAIAVAIVVAGGIGAAIGNAVAQRPAAPNPVTVGQKVRLVTVTETVAAVTRTVVVTG